MSTIVIEMIAEKLDQVILLLQVQKPAVVGEEKWTALSKQMESIRQGIADQQSMAKKDTHHLDALYAAIERIENLIKSAPVRASVEHKHRLHKGIWVSVGLLIILVILSWLLFDQIRLKDQFRENALKYRYLKVYGTRPVLELCNSLDSFYVTREHDFEDDVVSEEKRLLKMADSIKIAGERMTKPKHSKSKFAYK